METNEPKALTRDVEASIVPVGTKVTLQKGEQAYLTQSLGGTYTVVVNGNMFRIEGKDADALGLEFQAKPTTSTGEPVTQEQLEKQVWESLKTCYDPEIPVDIYELGLIYNVEVDDRRVVTVTMTLTSPACPVAESLPPEVESKVAAVDGVSSARVEITWEPGWTPEMMSEAARLTLGM